MALVHLFLAVLAILAKEVRCQCPNRLFQQSCYIIPYAEATWIGAVRYCQGISGHLATIESAEEHNFIANIIRSHNTVLAISREARRNFQTFHTPNVYKYHYLDDQGVNVYGRTSITFTVQACNDAHIALSARPVSTTETYEVVIGGWNDSGSAIRDCMRCGHMDELRQQDKLLDCNNPRPFWLSWQDGHIRLGTGLTVGENRILNWKDPQPHAVNHVGISTGFGSSGVWHFNNVQSLTYITPDVNKYQYLDDQGLNVYGHTSITFTVQACSDANIALSAGIDSTTETYEILIGGRSNSKSAIRDCMQCTNMDELRQQDNILDCNNPRPFWLSWQDGHLRVGTGLTVGENQMLNWQDSQPHAVNHVGIKTELGSSGVWHFNIGAYRPGVFWLGFTDAQLEGGWNSLPDMDEIAYTHWAQGQPSNAAFHHCAAMDGARGLDWIDANCQRLRNFICEL